MQQRRPVMLVILDGWGWREDAADNAVRQARTPNFDRLWASCPHALLHTSGKDVGLPHGQMGNSEVGHLNIGAGRVVMQDLPRIGDAIASGEIEKQPALQDLIAHLTAERRHLPSHGPGLAGRRAFASGSCGGPRARFSRRPACRPACISGRTAAIRRRNRRATMSARFHRGPAAVGADRDGVRALLCDGSRQALGARGEGLCGDGGGGRPALSRMRAPSIADAYAHKLYDEFIMPAVVGDYAGMRDGDGMLCFNFRADRVREILGRHPRSGLRRLCAPARRPRSPAPSG